MIKKEDEVFSGRLQELERLQVEARVALSNELITEAEYKERLENFHSEYARIRSLQRG